MARKVFFSFHYEADAWRAAIVRNRWVTYGGQVASGVIDAAEWEKIKRGGTRAIQHWILRELHGTTVTVVLIGTQTAYRDWVLYEIQKSVERENGLLGVSIHGLKDQGGYFAWQGENPFDRLKFSNGTPLSLVYPTFDYVLDDGYSNLDTWIEAAARAAGH